MRITNNFGLPEPLVRAVSSDVHPSVRRAGAFRSATELIDPPHLVFLRDTNWDDLEEDASDRIWAVFGTAVHGILAAGAEGELKEERLKITRNGKVISGQFDLITNGTTRKLVDWKTTSVWSIKLGYEEKLEQWTQQGNIYRLMVKECHGIELNEIEIVVLLRDWRNMEAKRDPGMPQSPIKAVKIEVWPFAKTEAFVAGRIEEHLNPEEICTPRERWVREEKWAVMKEGRARAISLRDTPQEAEFTMSQLLAQPKFAKAKLYVQHREGVQRRCEAFCPVAKLCKNGQQVHGIEDFDYGEGNS